MKNRHGNKTHTHGYPPEPNPNWRVFPGLTGLGYGLSPISKHRYGTGNGYIGTHPKPIPKPVPNVKNYFMLICHVILFDNCHVNKNYHWYLKEQLNHPVKQMLKWKSCWIMYYNIALRDAKKLLFFIKKNYLMRGWGGDTRTRRRRGWDSISHPRWVWVG